MPSTEDPQQLPTESSLLLFLDNLARREGVDADFASSLDKAREVLLGSLEAEGPFLTVLMRTQGRRLEPFKDALLCLAAQTSLDFEIILLAHGVEPENLAELQHAIDNQIPSFRSKISLVEVQGGGRATPLNRGLELARGRYVAVFDDDDLLFANWVEAFLTASSTGHGKLLRSIAATQNAAPEVWPQGEQGFRTNSWPNAAYAKAFDQLDHLDVNHSPFMSVAFPRYLFSSIGLRFDEKLDVCEDWDVILQGSLILGVHSVDSLTSIYRRWEGGASSYTSHSKEEWFRSEKRVIDRLNGAPQLLPVGQIARIRDRRIYVTNQNDEAARQLHEIHISKSFRLIARMRHIVARPRQILAGVKRRIKAL